jgi:ABC-type dipeptide/oligopeptide/nickel transport system ATPase component
VVTHAAVSSSHLWHTNCSSVSSPAKAELVRTVKQILALLEDLRQRLGLTMLFITHDLRVAAQVCGRVAVMQRGVIVE